MPVSYNAAKARIREVEKREELEQKLIAREQSDYFRLLSKKVDGGNAVVGWRRAPQVQGVKRRGEVLIWQLRVGHCHLTKAWIGELQESGQQTCMHCAQKATVKHVILNCPKVRPLVNSYLTQATLKTALFEQPRETLRLLCAAGTLPDPEEAYVDEMQEAQHETAD
eukprot:TRINITY_DN3520_c0_g1_i3.p1 TRINITY_DN3520_c0_g1~~TRINITY_DN3520_c0_g1_i3.p1  ORF type:complete len:167 (+),score=33.53 TRINITY_DN3520_c0_g1_i3:3-503(+)